MLSIIGEQNKEESKHDSSLKFSGYKAAQVVYLFVGADLLSEMVYKFHFIICVYFVICHF